MTLCVQMGSHIFGSGGGMAQPRHQPGMPQINPTVRAQVPHQFLAPQVHNFDCFIMLHYIRLAHYFQKPLLQVLSNHFQGNQDSRNS